MLCPTSAPVYAVQHVCATYNRQCLDLDFFSLSLQYVFKRTWILRQYLPIKKKKKLVRVTNLYSFAFEFDF